ncbi:transmembrane protein, putative [Medicago truncatula]|uniref:Transmembrane protein, putative n=1 Tax=Medicago truncatula TaxID=3880 RepID=G7KZ19_MEDTR|nr:transmembrane protein, putative [Medicago truncatula]
MIVGKVTGSSPGNNILCKNRVRLRTIHRMVGPLPGPCVCGSFGALGCPVIFFLDCDDIDSTSVGIEAEAYRFSMFEATVDHDKLKQLHISSDSPSKQDTDHAHTKRSS